MSKPNSLELADPIILGIALGDRPERSGGYSQVCADRSPVEKPVRRVLGVALSESSSSPGQGAWTLISKHA